MSAKHTPGPWQVNHNNPLQVCDADGEVRGCAPIATAWTPTQQITREAVANARLIAAAPELLEALKGAVDVLRSQLGFLQHADDIEKIDAARAAIAKVEA
jgi:hypothetical protein